MKRTPIGIPDLLPAEITSLVRGAALFDSSSSPCAKVIFIDKGCGYYLKIAERGSLKKEAELTDYFNKKGLSAPVIEYLSLDRDWLITERIKGEDATHTDYLSEPYRLAVTMGELLRELHSLDTNDCPIPDRMKDYFETVERNYQSGIFDPSFCGVKNPEEAYRIAMEGKRLLKSDTLIHGDFCLPNFLMDNWRFTGFVDLGGGGIGDRHIDLFWGAWTLKFNLGTDKYKDTFFDAYGKDLIDTDALLAASASETFG